MNDKPSRAIGQTFQFEQTELTRADIARICRVRNSMWTQHDFGLTGACNRCGFTIQELHGIQEEPAQQTKP